MVVVVAMVREKERRRSWRRGRKPHGDRGGAGAKGSSRWGGVVKGHGKRKWRGRGDVESLIHALPYI